MIGEGRGMIGRGKDRRQTMERKERRMQQKVGGRKEGLEKERKQGMQSPRRIGANHVFKCAGMPHGGFATCLFLRDANSWQGCDHVSLCRGRTRALQLS